MTVLNDLIRIRKNLDVAIGALSAIAEVSPAYSQQEVGLPGRNGKAGTKRKRASNSATGEAKTVRRGRKKST